MVPLNDTNAAADHVFLKRSLRARHEGEQRDLVLSDVLSCPLQRHCECCGSAMEVRLLDDRHARYRRFARRGLGRCQIEGCCRAGRQRQRGEKQA